MIIEMLDNYWIFSIMIFENADSIVYEFINE